MMDGEGHNCGSKDQKTVAEKGMLSVSRVRQIYYSIDIPNAPCAADIISDAEISSTSTPSTEILSEIE